MSVGSFVNTTIGSYRLIDFIGAGGMGEVYRAIRVGGTEVVAVKLLLGAQGAEMSQRFRNEARIHSALRHPNIAAMREFIESVDAPAIAMEFIDGDSLDMRIRQRGAMSTREALQIFAPVVDALGYMHQRGVLHRDIKPSNVKIARDGTPKLLDFGIAKSALSPKLTATGAVIGTWHYLSPEQLLAGTAETRSDLWALGVLLYEMVTGRHPFDSAGMASLTERILSADYTPASRINRSLSSGIDRMIARCLTVRVEDRYQSAEQVLSDIRAMTAPPAVKVAAEVARVESPRAVWRLPALPAFKMPTFKMPAQFKIPGQLNLQAPFDLPRLSLVRKRANSIAAQSGVWWQQARPLAAAIGVAMVVGLVAYNVTPRSGEGETGDSTTTGSVVVPSLPVGGSTNSPVFNYSPVQPTGNQTVSITTLELPADVWIDGQHVGSTPYTMTRPLGTEVQLVLKRNGYRDSVVKFPVSINKPEYNIQLERVHEDSPNEFAVTHADRASGKSPERPSAPPESPRMMFAGAALFLRRIFGRGRDSAARDRAIKSTMELGVVTDATGARMELISESGLATDTGCVRSSNEDSIRVILADAAHRGVSGDLAIVCDGMGGHEGGEVASRMAIDTIIARYHEDSKQPGVSLARSVEMANRVVFEASVQDARLHGMGTTCTALLVRGDQAYCSHVGDSRLYLVRDREIFLMTEDHSQVMDLVRKGVISREEARHHPDKNVISRALGVRREVQVASWSQPFGVRPNDRFLVCSDGLYDLVEDADILTAVLDYNVQGACDRLVALARNNGGYDNISVAILALSSPFSSNSAMKTTRIGEVMQ